MRTTAPRSSSFRPRWYWPALVVIFLLGLMLRVWFWQDQARASSIGKGDEDEYFRGAIHLLLNGDYYDTGKWLRPPVTSLYFAAAFALFGVNLPLALLLQSALSLVAVALVAVLTRRLFAAPASPRAPPGADVLSRKPYLASVIAAAATAFYLPYAAYGSRILSETLFIVLLALAMVLLERTQRAVRAAHPSPSLLFFSGVAIGLAILTRAFLFYFVPLLFLWLWYERRNFRAGLVAFLWLASGVILVVAPWSIRNYFVYHQVVLVETEGGYSFLNGTDPGQNDAELQSYWIPNYPNSAERQRAQYAVGIENVRRAPLAWIARIKDKVTGLWHLHLRNLANNGANGATLQLGDLNFALVSDVEYIVLMLAALAGVALARRDRIFWPLLLLPLYTTLVGAVTVTSVRIREPLMLTVIVYAAPVLADPRSVFRALAFARRFRLSAYGAAVVVFAALIYNSAYPGLLESRIWLLLCSFGGGEGAIQRAVAADSNSILPYLAAGDWQMSREDPEAALQSYERASALVQDNTEVQARIIQARRRLGDEAGARAAVQPVAGSDLDNPQWYEWAWNRVPFWPLGEVDPSTPAVGIMRGVYAVAGDSPGLYRWTLDRAAFRVSAPGAARLLLSLRADEPKAVLVYMDGDYLGTVSVTREWRDYRVTLAARAGDRSLIELHTPLTVVSTDNPYPRGVAVSRVMLEP